MTSQQQNPTPETTDDSGPDEWVFGVGSALVSAPRDEDVRARQTTVPPCDDAEVMRLWREAGLPEYFLGNGGSNHRLVAFAALIRANAERSAFEAGFDAGQDGGIRAWAYEAWSGQQ